MRIVDRKTFLAMPEETVFAKYATLGNIGEVCIKGETYVNGDGEGIDFLYQPLANSVDANDTGAFVDAMAAAECALRVRWNRQAARARRGDRRRGVARWPRAGTHPGQRDPDGHPVGQRDGGCPVRVGRAAVTAAFMWPGAEERRR